VDGEGEELRPKPISHEQKVREHEKKKEHLYAVKEFDKQQPKDTVVMPNFMERTSSELLYARTVRTVHTMCIKQFALSSANALLDLQWANGLVISYDHVHTGGELGSGGLTDWLEAGARVFAAIERDRAANSVARTVFPDGLLFGFMGDGSNDRSLMEREAVALRYIGPDGMPYNTLFDLGTLDLKESVDGFSPDAKCITACYVNSLKALDLHDGFLRQSSWQASVVAGSFDGASVMLGSQKGVAAKMKDLVPHMVFVHAAAHVQQLAMADAFQICEYFDKWRKTVQEVYVYYRLSGKKAFSLSQIAEQIGDDLLKLRGTHGIRWAASQHKSIEALLQDLNAIIIDLEMAAKREVGLELTSLSPSELFVKRQFTQLWEDEAGGRPRRWRATVTKILPSELGAVYDRFELKYSDRSTSQVSKAELIDLITDGDRLKDSPVYILRADISTTRFVLFSAFMMDVHHHLGVLSKSFQSNTLLISDLPKNISKTVRALQKLKTDPGPKEAEVRAACVQDGDANIYKSCRLSGPKDGFDGMDDDRKTICDSLVEELNERYAKVLKHSVLEAFSVFENRGWPEDREKLEEFGINEIKLLYEHYRIFFTEPLNDVLDQWLDLKTEYLRTVGLRSRSFKELWPHMLTHYTAEFGLVLRLVAIMLLIPIDTSECERIFSLMNDVKSALRNSLGERNLRNLMLWHYHGKKLSFAQLPIGEIIQEFMGLASEATLNANGRRGPHRGRTPLSATDAKLKELLEMEGERIPLSPSFSTSVSAKS
jgi:hypothetical protein